MIDETLLQNILRLQEPDGGLAFTPMDKGAAASRMVGANDAACVLLGYTKEELLAVSPDRIITNLEALAGGEPLLDTGSEHIVQTLTTRNGDRIPVEIRCHPLETGSGPVNVVTVRDITRRLQRERQSQLDEQRFKTLYNLTRIIDRPEEDILNYALAQSVILTDSLSGYVCIVNDAQTELTLHAWTDRSMNECQVESPRPVLKVEDEDKWSEALRLRRAVISDHADSPEKKRCWRTGRPVVRHLDLPVIDNGAVRIVAGVTNKDEPYTESDVVQLSLIMEGVWRIIERKRMETDLLLAKRAAENANLAKSQLMANMSHELRTPLNGIMGMSQMLLGTRVTDEQREYLTLALEAATHLSKVMTSLLDLSHIETGELAVSSTDFNLPDTIASILAPLGAKAENKGLEFTHSLGKDVPVVVGGDADKFRQIINNLVYNAIKFTESGRVAVNVSATPDGETSEVRIEVADSGIGIPPDKHEAVFESFTLGEDFLTKRYGGVGLGLSISRKLAGIMGGTITLDSVPGQGSTFTLILPLEVRQAGDDSCTGQEPETGVSGLNILVAEDEQVNALITSRILKKHGHHPTVVGNGQHAIDALMREQFDLVLMDVQMPVINGLQVTEIIRSGAAENIDSIIPIIGLTAFAAESDRQRFLAAGMNEVVTKPFDASDLVETICRFAGQPT